MNISQLSAFHAVMTSSTLTEAADRLGRTQPAISAAIKSLEDQLGMKLFERRGRKLVPVPEAHYLATEASAILSQLTQVRQTMRGLGDGQSGQLNLAAMPGPVAMLFPRFVARQIGRKPGIRVSMLARSSNQIAELARAQSIDFGFADLPEDFGSGGLFQAEVVSGDCFAALPIGHPLAAERRISLESLSGQPMGSLQASHVHSREVQAAFHDGGHQLNTVVESQTFLPILQFIAAGQCCAIFDPLTIVHVNELGVFADSVVIRPLDQTLRYRYALISPSHRPTSIAAADIRDAWAAEVQRFLVDVGADPTWHIHSNDEISAS